MKKDYVFRIKDISVLWIKKIINSVIVWKKNLYNKLLNTCY